MITKISDASCAASRSVPTFEVCTWQRGHARLLWLLPITATERAFKAGAGLDALEDRFENAGLDFLDPGRAALA